MLLSVVVTARPRYFFAASAFVHRWFVADSGLLAVHLGVRALFSSLALDIRSFGHFRCVLIVRRLLYRWRSLHIQLKLRAAGNVFFLLGDHGVVEFCEVGEVVDDYLSVVLVLSARVVIQPQGLEVRQLDEISDFAQISDTVLSQVQLLS